MRCVWKLLVLFAILPVFAIGCGPASMNDDVTQEEIDSEAAEAEEGEAAEESEGTGDESEDGGSEESEDEE
ncbi:MAG TPA: hypothetical protein QF564_10820 [Pirellulaceae bacterium]|nr:hypothetical protein [Pirellulaceae bacterium]